MNWSSTVTPSHDGDETWVLTRGDQTVGAIMHTHRGYEHTLNRRCFETWGECYMSFCEEVERTLAAIHAPPFASTVGLGSLEE